MNFLNIEKKKFKIYFFQYFKFSSRFMVFPTLKKKIGVKKKKNPGGGGVDFFFEFLFSHFTFYAIFNIKKKIIMRLEILKSAPSLTG